MNIKKLKLEKFTVSKLSNSSIIIGGNGDDGTVIFRPDKPLCTNKSKKFIYPKR